MRPALSLASVALVAVLAGVAVAGLPTSVPDDIVATDIRPPASSADVSVSSSTTLATTTTSAVASTTETVEAPETTESPDTTVPARTTTRSTTTSSTSSTTTAPPAPTSTLLPTNAVRVVVANAGGANDLAARFAETVRRLGYVEVTAANASDRRGTSVVYWAPEREGEARRLAEQLGIRPVEGRPGGEITLGGQDADVWVVLGGDQL